MFGISRQGAWAGWSRTHKKQFHQFELFLKILIILSKSMVKDTPIQDRFAY